MVRLTLLEKKLVLQSEISTYSLSYSIFKNIEILLGQGVVKVNEIDVPDYQ